MSNRPPTADMKPIIRWALTLSSVAMLVFAGFTFTGVLPMQSFVGYFFIGVALVDLVIAYTVFKD